MKCAIVEGIISVANHKLRVDGVESYKEYFSKEFLNPEDVKEAIKNFRNGLEGGMTHYSNDVNQDVCFKKTVNKMINTLIKELGLEKENE